MITQDTVPKAVAFHADGGEHWITARNCELVYATDEKTKKKLSLTQMKISIMEGDETFPKDRFRAGDCFLASVDFTDSHSIQATVLCNKIDICPLGYPQYWLKVLRSV